MRGMSLRLGVNLRPAVAGRGASLRVAAVVCLTLAGASAERAIAADWPLRGSVEPSYVRWDGWQFGVLAGYGNMNDDFGNSTSPLVAFILRNSTLENEAQPSAWTTLPANSTNGPVFGGFLGYNWQWSELVRRVGSCLQASVDPAIFHRRLARTPLYDIRPCATRRHHYSVVDHLNSLIMRLCGGAPDMLSANFCPTQRLASRSGASTIRQA